MPIIDKIPTNLQILEYGSECCKLNEPQEVIYIVVFMINISMITRLLYFHSHIFLFGDCQILLLKFFYFCTKVFFLKKKKKEREIKRD